jgi:hypothetical protein
MKNGNINAHKEAGRTALLAQTGRLERGGVRMSENRRKSDRLNIRIEPELKAEFAEYLEETGRTMSWLVTRWIREELERWKEARR